MNKYLTLEMETFGLFSFNISYKFHHIEQLFYGTSRLCV